MTPTSKVVVLVDVDNTLLDNDKAQDDPFHDLLYPYSLDVLKWLRSFGPTVVLATSAAPMSSSGFVRWPFSKRDAKEYGSSKAPLPQRRVTNSQIWRAVSERSVACKHARRSGVNTVSLPTKSPLTCR